MELTRREMLRACAAIPLGLPTTFLHESSDQRDLNCVYQPPKVVRFSNYQGPGKSNRINSDWAEFIFANYECEECSIKGGNKKITKMVMQFVEKCFLPKFQPEWFTDARDNWKEQYIWYGDVRLVKETFYLTNGHVKVDYYCCRGDDAVILRRAKDNEHCF